MHTTVILLVETVNAGSVSGFPGWQRYLCVVHGGFD